MVQRVLIALSMLFVLVGAQQAHAETLQQKQQRTLDQYFGVQSSVVNDDSEGGPVASVASLHHHRSATKWHRTTALHKEVASVKAETKWASAGRRIVAHTTNCWQYTFFFWSIKTSKHWKWLDRAHHRGNSWCNYHARMHMGFSFLAVTKYINGSVGQVVRWDGARRHWRS